MRSWGRRREVRDKEVEGEPIRVDALWFAIDKKLNLYLRLPELGRSRPVGTTSALQQRHAQG